ncbi:MAG: GreA/GreB family elongation factor [Bdellovibrionales bacterium]|nr:GreA/GreB family elongation factor [Bdellovibrionales bacterium]
MDKLKIVKLVLDELDKRVNILVQAALDAKDAATNEESKAENKYDTRGLEASYLAGAQAQRANELVDSIRKLKELKITHYSDNDEINITSLVEVMDDSRNYKWFFILPYAAGIEITYKDLNIQTLSPQTPLAKKLIGQSKGDLIEWKSKNNIFEYEVSKIF